jgi:hypothetical protein
MADPLLLHIGTAWGSRSVEADDASLMWLSEKYERSARLILYKYMRADAAKAILSGRSIGFSNPHTFNDPFELTAYPPQVDLPIPSFLDSVQTWAKQSIWSENHGVLCLTKSIEPFDVGTLR